MYYNLLVIFSWQIPKEEEDCEKGDVFSRKYYWNIFDEVNHFALPDLSNNNVCALLSLYLDKLKFRCLLRELWN